MAHHGSSSISIDSSKQEIFDVIADIDAYPEWLSDIKQVEVLERDDDGRALVCTMTVDVTIRTVTYTLEYDWNAPDGVSWKSRPGGDVKYIEGSYDLELNDDGTTQARYDLTIDPGFPVPGFMLKKALRHITKAALDGLKLRTEQN